MQLHGQPALMLIMSIEVVLVHGEYESPPYLLPSLTKAVQNSEWTLHLVPKTSETYPNAWFVYGVVGQFFHCGLIMYTFVGFTALWLSSLWVVCIGPGPDLWVPASFVVRA